MLEGSVIFWGLRTLTGSSCARGRFGGRLFRRRGNAETHEEETKAFAEGIEKTHGMTFPETPSEYREGQASAKAGNRFVLGYGTPRNLLIF